jgi:phage tail-like protein
VRDHLGDLISPCPIGATLPAVFEQDWYTQQICAAFDEVLAPVFATLDSLPAYFDPATAPADMLGWLGGWIGIAFNGHEAEKERRELIRTGAELLPWRGTARGVRQAVRAVYGTEPEVIDSGGTVCSTESGTQPPGSDSLGLLVRLIVPNPADIDLRRLHRLVVSLKPAHVPHRLEVVASG